MPLNLFALPIIATIAIIVTTVTIATVHGVADGLRALNVSPPKSIRIARRNMQTLNDLWHDECGLVLSAEVVTIGTLGVLGAVVGLNAASTAVDQELKEFAGAIRSLDQSYGYAGHQSCRAWTAGSYYRQQDVQQSLADLCAGGSADIAAIEKQVEAQRSAHWPTKSDATSAPAVTPVPNQIPVPQLKQDAEKKAGSKAGNGHEEGPQARSEG